MPAAPGWGWGELIINGHPRKTLRILFGGWREWKGSRVVVWWKVKNYVTGKNLWSIFSTPEPLLLFREIEKMCFSSLEDYTRWYKCTFVFSPPSLFFFFKSSLCSLVVFKRIIDLKELSRSYSHGLSIILFLYLRRDHENGLFYVRSVFFWIIQIFFCQVRETRCIFLS